jgi:hypothetical protein
MKTYGGMEVQLHHSWLRYYMEVSSHLHASDALPPGKEPSSTHWREVWVGPRAGLDTVEKGEFVAPAENGTAAGQVVARRYTDWAIPAPLTE